MFSGSASRFSFHISAVSFAPHSRSTNGATLRPVPCSALSEPSYFPTTRSTTSGHERAVVRNLFRIVQEWRDQKVQVSGRGMAEYDALIAMLAEQGLKIERAVGEALRREAHVLQNE